MAKITKLTTDQKIPFNKVAIDREMRLIKNKINEIIDVLNEQNTSVYADDFEDDELEEMIKAGDDGGYVFTPEEAQNILNDRKKSRKETLHD